MKSLELPDLQTTTMLYGQASRDEVGGPPCVAVFIGIFVGN